MPPCCLPYSKGSLYFLRIMLLPAKDQNEPTLSPQLRSLRFRGSSAPQMAQELREGMATRQRDENPWQQTAARDPVRTVSSPSRGTACCSSHFTSALRSLSLSLSGHFPPQRCTIPEYASASSLLHCIPGTRRQVAPWVTQGVLASCGYTPKRTEEQGKKNPTNQNPVHRQKVVNLKCCLN